MTRKDYELIASVLRANGEKDWRGENARETWEEICEELADSLAIDNPRFDRERFLAACGIEA